MRLQFLYKKDRLPLPCEQSILQAQQLPRYSTVYQQVSKLSKLFIYFQSSCLSQQTINHEGRSSQSQRSPQRRSSFRTPQPWRLRFEAITTRAPSQNIWVSQSELLREPELDPLLQSERKLERKGSSRPLCRVWWILL